jgi:predicted RNA-binding Zn-ribbon protein involved in translation (DUF1610 family)
MPRKTKVTAIPVEAPDEGLVRALPTDDDKTDAQQMTDVINEVRDSVDEQPLNMVEPEPVVEAAPKKKRAAPKKAKAPEPEVKVESTINETTVEVQMPAERAKRDAKVSCPDCGKQVSSKTLKYSHVPNCTAKKQTMTPREEVVRDDRRVVQEDMIEYEVQQRLTNRRAERAERRQEMVNKLMQNAF